MFLDILYMFVYIVYFCIGFVFDKVKNKIVNVVFYNSSKKLLLCYTKEWHDEQRKTIMQMLEWVLL